MCISFLPWRTLRAAYDRRNEHACIPAIDAVHQEMETENFVVNPILWNTRNLKKNRATSSRPTCFERRARQKKEIITEKGRENGEKIGAASRGRIKVLRSILVGYIQRSEDERKREPGVCGAPLALLRQRVIVRPFLRSFQRPRGACNGVSPGFHRFLVRPLAFSGLTKLI